jgi:hypothetical protein
MIYSSSRRLSNEKNMRWLPKNLTYLFEEQDRQCSIEARSRNQLLPWKSNKYYILWVCVCSLSYPAYTAHAPYYIVICGLSGCTVFFHIFHKLRDLRENVFEHKTCVLIFSTNLSKTLHILRRIQWHTIIHVHRSSCKVPLLLSDFNDTWIFSTDFQSIVKYQISWKSVQWEPSCSMRTDRQTDLTKLIVAFS